MIKELSIGEVARSVGIQSSAIRYYESMGLIECEGRVGGKRRYTNEAVTRLKVIQLAKDTGFTIREIQQILKERTRHGARGSWRPFAAAKLKELDDKLQNIKLMKKLLQNVLECQCDGPVNCSMLNR